LKEKNALTRRSSATVLSQIEPIPEGAVPALQSGLKDHDPAVRLNVAACLCNGARRVKEAIPVLSAALKDRSLRSQAVEVLGRTGPQASEAIPALLEALQGDNRDYAFVGRAGSALEQIAGPESVKLLLQALTRVPKRFRPLIVEALGQTGAAGLPALIKLVDDEDPAVCAVAARSLGHAGRSAVDAVPALIKALQHKEGQVRREAVQSVGAIGAAAQAAMPALIEILNDDQGENRILASEAMAYVAPGNSQAVSALAAIAGGSDVGFRRQAIAALGRIGPKAVAAIPALAEALRSADPMLRVEAALSLAHVGIVDAASPPRSVLGDTLSDEVLSLLLDLVRERNHPSRTRAMEALEQAGFHGESAVAVLTRALWDEGAARIKAAEALGRMGPLAKSAIPGLSELLKRPEPAARIQAALALWRIDRQAEQAVPVLVSELKCRTARGQTRVLLVPGRFGVISSMPPEPPCRQAAEALGVMGSAARAAVPALRQALMEPDEAVRSAAAEALKKIDG
jgi:HEAT repeat protein